MSYMTEREAMARLDQVEERLTEWFLQARECDENILRVCGLRATMMPLARHDMSRFDIGLDLAHLIKLRALAVRDYGIGWMAIRNELKRMLPAVARYALACCRIGSIEPVMEYVYSGRPQSRLSLVSPS